MLHTPSLDSEFATLLAPIQAFLRGETPGAWLLEAKKPENLAIILRDHLLCEMRGMCRKITHYFHYFL